jgi:hypothetical protein
MTEGKKENPALVPDILVDEGTSRGHEKRLSEYAAHKVRQNAVSAYILEHHPEYRKQYHRLQSCSYNLHFWHFLEKDVWKMRDGVSCKQHLLCGCCGRNRSVRYSNVYAEKIQYLLSQRPELVPVLITRTVKNGEDLDECWQRLNNAHHILIQRRREALSVSCQTRGKFRNTIMRHIAGSAGTYEFKKGSGSGLWHPHSHEIALLEPGFKFTSVLRKGKWVDVPLEFEGALIEEWKEATNGSFMVDVRRIDQTDEKDFFGSLLEVFSYTLKISSLTIEDQLHAYTVLCASGRSRRLIFSYGCLWGVKLPEGCADLVGDELKFEKYLDVYYRFNASGGCYDFDRDRSDPEVKIYDGSQPLRRASRKSSPKRQEFSSHFTADQVSQFVKKYVKLQANSDEEPF